MENDHNSYYYAHKADLLHQALMGFFCKFWNDTGITGQLIDINDLNELMELASKIEELLTPVNH